jgi:hypothetical protein
MAFFSKIRGTYESLFQIAKGGAQIKHSAGVLEIRDPTDAAFAILRGLPPVGSNDFVTLGSLSGSLSLVVVRMPLLLVTKVSGAAIPDNATIFWSILDVTTPYSGGTTWAVTRTGDGTKVLLATGDSDPTVAASYQVPNVLDWGAVGAGTVTATVAGAPGVGAATLYVAYATPTDIS